MLCNWNYFRFLLEFTGLCTLWPPVLNRKIPFLLTSCQCMTCWKEVFQMIWSTFTSGFISRTCGLFAGKTLIFTRLTIASIQFFYKKCKYLFMYLYHPYFIMQFHGFRLTPLKELASNSKIPYFLSFTIIATWSLLNQMYHNLHSKWNVGPLQKNARLQRVWCRLFGSWMWIRLMCSKHSILSQSGTL